MNAELKNIKNKLRQYKPILEEQYKIREIGVFGSFVRGEQKKKSDLDILVDFCEPLSLIDFMRLENHLSKYLDIRVDLVMKDSLKPRIGRHILREVITI